MANQAYSEPEERWGGRHGPAAVDGRLRDIEMRLGQLRGELGEVGRWALHPECPDISRPLKRVREILQDTEREIRQARQGRLHDRYRSSSTIWIGGSDVGAAQRPIALA